MVLEADAVVVGSGAGGGVAAAALAAAGKAVVVLEAGPFVDERTMPTNELDAFDRLYLNHGLLATWDGSITMLSGSGVGGGTLVNWMTCIDAPEAVRAEWAADHGLGGVTGSAWDADVAAVEAELGVAEIDRHPAQGRGDPARCGQPGLGGCADPPERHRLRRPAAVARSGVPGAPSSPGSASTSPRRTPRAPGSSRDVRVRGSCSTAAAPSASRATRWSRTPRPASR